MVAWFFFLFFFFEFAGDGKYNLLAFLREYQKWFSIIEGERRMICTLFFALFDVSLLEMKYVSHHGFFWFCG